MICASELVHVCHFVTLLSSCSAAWWLAQNYESGRQGGELSYQAADSNCELSSLPIFRLSYVRQDRVSHNPLMVEGNNNRINTCEMYRNVI